MPRTMGLSRRCGRKWHNTIADMTSVMPSETACQRRLFSRVGVLATRPFRVVFGSHRTSVFRAGKGLHITGRRVTGSAILNGSGQVRSEVIEWDLMLDQIDCSPIQSSRFAFQVFSATLSGVGSAYLVKTSGSN